MSEEQVPPPPESPPPPPPPPSPGAPPPPITAPASAAPDDTNRIILLILSYCGPLALLPFFLEKEDAEVHWHSKHGLVIFAAEVVVGTVFSILNIVLFSCLFPLLILVIFVLALLAFAFHAVCIVKAINGDRLKVPFLSDFADSF